MCISITPARTIRTTGQARQKPTGLLAQSLDYVTKVKRLEYGDFYMPINTNLSRFGHTMQQSNWLERHALIRVPQHADRRLFMDYFIFLFSLPYGQHVSADYTDDRASTSKGYWPMGLSLNSWPSDWCESIDCSDTRDIRRSYTTPVLSSYPMLPWYDGLRVGRVWLIDSYTSAWAWQGAKTQIKQSIWYPTKQPVSYSTNKPFFYSINQPLFYSIKSTIHVDNSCNLDSRRVLVGTPLLTTSQSNCEYWSNIRNF